MKNNTAEEIRESFSRPGRTAVIGHVRPDGDCISSVLALKAYLKSTAGTEADAFAGNFDSSLRMLPGSDTLRADEPEEVYDTVFVVDCSTAERAGAGSSLLKTARRVINIDHHISNDYFGNLNYVLPQASSACEVLFGLMDGESLNRDIAVCLYTGMVHDTGVFQYSNVSPYTLEAAAKLISCGVPFGEIIQKTFYEKSFEEQKALGFALSRASLAAGGEVIWSYITLDEQEALGVDAVGLNGIVEILRNTRGAETSVFLYETEPGEFKASTRSKDWMNVSEICAQFGGGGHVHAAGCSFSGKTPDEIMKELLSVMPSRQLTGETEA